MAESNKTYYPTAIPPIPFPDQAADTSIPAGGQASIKDDSQLSPDVVAANVMAMKRVADEVLSTSLNTQSKRILGIYEFGQLGALQIGKYVNGVAGDLRITPDGLTARNSAGTITFAIDGTTGDASFAGTVTANAGAIGGFTIQSSYLYAGIGANSVGLSPADYPFWAGATYASRATAPFRVTVGGVIYATGAVIDGTSTVGGRLASTLASAINTAGHFIDTALDTSAKTILGSFTFGTSGAITIQTDASNGLWLSPTGILAKKSGSNTFTIDNAGNATFAGTLAAGVIVAAGALVVGTNVDTGTAQTASQVTTIIGNTVTTGYVNALNVTAQYVVASVSLSSPSISGGSIAIGSGNSIFKADSNGIYLGNTTFVSAPFRVNMSGAVVASNITIENGNIGSGSTWTGNQIANAYIGNLNANKITTGTMSADRISAGTISSDITISGTLSATRGWIGTGLKLGGFAASVNNFDCQVSASMQSTTFNGTVSMGGNSISGTNAGTNFSNGNGYVNDWTVNNNCWVRYNVDAHAYLTHSDVFEGNPFEVISTIKPEKAGSGKVNMLKKINHLAVHRLLQDNSGPEPAFSLSGLVMAQNEAILQLNKRLSELEKK